MSEEEARYAWWLRFSLAYTAGLPVCLGIARAVGLL